MEVALHFLGVQVAGVLSVAAYVAVIIAIVFLAIKYTIGLRADYRGVQVEANLLPKVQVDIVVSAVPVRKVIETAKKDLMPSGRRIKSEWIETK